jgi:hypothetical protein
VHCYATADEIRKEILAGPLKQTNLSVEQMQRALQRGSAINELSDLQTKRTTNRGGIITSDVCEQINNLLQILNDK